MHATGVGFLALVAAATAGPVAAAEVAPRPAPAITAGRWLNSPPLDLAALRGRVVLLEFWTFACINCQHVEPAIKRWHAKYRDRGLTVIAVHTPELDLERDPANVADYAAAHGLTYPIAIDNDFATWERYENDAWPAVYLIDRHGALRYRHIGEGAYGETERQIELLLAEQPAASAAADHTAGAADDTPTHR